MDQILLSLDSKYNIKRDYEESLNEAFDEVSIELGKLASVTSNDKQKIKDLVKRAAELWLEVGKQRRRSMFLVMSDSGHVPSRSGNSAISQYRSMGPVVVPELRRTGNSLGEKLERNELAMDRKGAVGVFVLADQDEYMESLDHHFLSGVPRN